MAKKVKKVSIQQNNEQYVPTEFIQNSLLEENPILVRIINFIKKYKIIGPLTWERLENSDKILADEFRIYIEENRERLNLKYSQFGANLEKAEVKRNFKRSKPQPILKTIATKKTPPKVKVKTTKERIQEAKELLNKDINTLGIKEIKFIMDYSGIDYEHLEPYWKKRNELKNKKPDYNKPKPLQAAKALLTFNFSGKSNPSKWIDYDPIIKAKLYCAKMGIEYLTKEAPKELATIMAQVNPNLDKVLESLNYKDINEVKF